MKFFKQSILEFQTYVKYNEGVVALDYCKILELYNMNPFHCITDKSKAKKSLHNLNRYNFVCYENKICYNVDNKFLPTKCYALECCKPFL